MDDMQTLYEWAGGRVMQPHGTMKKKKKKERKMWKISE